MYEFREEGSDASAAENSPIVSHVILWDLSNLVSSLDANQALRQACLNDNAAVIVPEIKNLLSKQKKDVQPVSSEKKNMGDWFATASILANETPRTPSGETEPSTSTITVDYNHAKRINVASGQDIKTAFFMPLYKQFTALGLINQNQKNQVQILPWFDPRVFNDPQNEKIKFVLSALKTAELLLDERCKHPKAFDIDGFWFAGNLQLAQEFDSNASQAMTPIDYILKKAFLIAENSGNQAEKTFANNEAVWHQQTQLSDYIPAFLALYEKIKYVQSGMTMVVPTEQDKKALSDYSGRKIVVECSPSLAADTQLALTSEFYRIIFTASDLSALNWYSTAFTLLEPSDQYQLCDLLKAPMYEAVCAFFKEVSPEASKIVVMRLTAYANAILARRVLPSDHFGRWQLLESILAYLLRLNVLEAAASDSVTVFDILSDRFYVITSDRTIHADHVVRFILLWIASVLSKQVQHSSDFLNEFVAHLTNAAQSKSDRLREQAGEKLELLTNQFRQRRGNANANQTKMQQFLSEYGALQDFVIDLNTIDAFRGPSSEGVYCQQTVCLPVGFELDSFAKRCIQLCVVKENLKLRQKVILHKHESGQVDVVGIVTVESSAAVFMRRTSSNSNLDSPRLSAHRQHSSVVIAHRGRRRGVSLPAKVACLSFKEEDVIVNDAKITFYQACAGSLKTEWVFSAKPILSISRDEEDADFAILKWYVPPNELVCDAQNPLNSLISSLVYDEVQNELEPFAIEFSQVSNLVTATQEGPTLFSMMYLRHQLWEVCHGYQALRTQPRTPVPYLNKNLLAHSTRSSSDITNEHTPLLNNPRIGEDQLSLEEKLAAWILFFMTGEESTSVNLEKSKIKQWIKYLTYVGIGVSGLIVWRLLNINFEETVYALGKGDPILLGSQDIAKTSRTSTITLTVGVAELFLRMLVERIFNTVEAFRSSRALMTAPHHQFFDSVLRQLSLAGKRSERMISALDKVCQDPSMRDNTNAQKIVRLNASARSIFSNIRNMSSLPQEARNLLLDSEKTERSSAPTDVALQLRNRRVSDARRYQGSFLFEMISGVILLLSTLGVLVWACVNYTNVLDKTDKNFLTDYIYELVVGSGVLGYLVGLMALFVFADDVKTAGKYIFFEVKDAREKQLSNVDHSTNQATNQEVVQITSENDVERGQRAERSHRFGSCVIL